MFSTKNNSHLWSQLQQSNKLWITSFQASVTGDFEDTWHFAVLVDDHEVREVPGDALGNDPLQGQTSSVVHMGVWDYCGQLLAKPHRPLQGRTDTIKKAFMHKPSYQV